MTLRSHPVIQDAISLQDYSQTARAKQSNASALPVTLLWYPKLSDSKGLGDSSWAYGDSSLVPAGGTQSTFNCDDNDDWDLDSVRELFN
jgi:hypothetical protein